MAILNNPHSTTMSLNRNFRFSGSVAIPKNAMRKEMVLVYTGPQQFNAPRPFETAGAELRVNGVHYDVDEDFNILTDAKGNGYGVIVKTFAVDAADDVRLVAVAVENE